MESIGRKGRDFFRKRGMKIHADHVGILGNPRYEEAMTYKNLLLRQKALLTKDPKEANALVEEATEWFNKALAARKANEEKKASAATEEKK